MLSVEITVITRALVTLTRAIVMCTRALVRVTRAKVACTRALIHVTISGAKKFSKLKEVLKMLTHLKTIKHTAGKKKENEENLEKLTSLKVNNVVASRSINHSNKFKS